MYSIYERNNFSSPSFTDTHMSDDNSIDSCARIDYHLYKLETNPVITFPKDNLKTLWSINDKLGFMLLLDLLKENYFNKDDLKSIDKCKEIVKKINDKKDKFWNGNSLVARVFRILENDYNIKPKLEFDENTYSEIEDEFFCITKNYLFYYEEDINKQMFYDTINRKTKKKRLPQEDNELKKLVFNIICNNKIVIRDFDVYDKKIQPNYDPKLKSSYKNGVTFYLYSDISKDKNYASYDDVSTEVINKLTVDGVKIPISFIDCIDKSLYNNPIDKFSLFMSEVFNNTSLRYSNIEQTISSRYVPSLDNYRYDDFIYSFLSNKVEFEYILNKRNNIKPFGDSTRGISYYMYHIFCINELINYKSRASEFRKFWNVILSEDIILTFEYADIVKLEDIVGE